MLSKRYFIIDIDDIKWKWSLFDFLIMGVIILCCSISINRIFNRSKSNFKYIYIFCTNCFYCFGLKLQLVFSVAQFQS